MYIEREQQGAVAVTCGEDGRAASERHHQDQIEPGDERTRECRPGQRRRGKECRRGEEAPAKQVIRAGKRLHEEIEQCGPAKIRNPDDFAALHSASSTTGQTHSHPMTPQKE